jgi:hypothetical protein
MKPLFHKLLVKAMDDVHDCLKKQYRTVSDPKLNCRFYPQYLVVGDQKQCIFAFGGADARYLIEAEQIMPFAAHREWVTLNLSISYRLTPNMVLFFLTFRILISRDTGVGF